MIRKSNARAPPRFATSADLIGTRDLGQASKMPGATAAWSARAIGLDDPLARANRWHDPPPDQAYEEGLADLLGELACGRGADGDMARALGNRARSSSDRLFAQHLATRLTGPDCRPATELVDEVRKELEKLAASLDQE
jgi:hypothetical protein